MKINLITIGCPKNLVDSEVLLGGLKGEGIEIIENPLEADTIILNTCGFIQQAKEESIEAIIQALELKKQGNCQKVFVTGCLSQRYYQEMRKEIPEVDGFFGNRDLAKILKKLTRQLDLKGDILGERMLTTPSHYAYLKISEGCENPCTFCSIPGIRGKFRSRSIESLVDEAQMLVSKGVKELIVVAQDTTMFGQDLYGKKQLVPLLKRLSQIKEIKWIRLLYTYPAHFSDDLIEIISDKHNICNYIDLPIQHISDKLLKKMARKVNRRDIELIIEKLRSKIPEIAIRTSLITGFPGETEQNFQELVEFIKDVRFERLGLFTYSREEYTPAYHFPNQIPDHIKQERWAELNDIQNQISSEINHSLIGSIQEVVIDEFNADLGTYVGRTSWDCPEIDNSVFIDEKVDLGKFYWVKITNCSDYDLRGKLIQ
ncbi:MAG: 30S ribosomal protein S12 methylthiotransferase RimO [bacterium]